MINHSNCDHPSTKSARAKCRRYLNADGVEFTRSATMRGGGLKGQVPRDKDKTCDNCGVERITLRGTDPMNGVLRYVGEKCSYILKQAADITPLD